MLSCEARLKKKKDFDLVYKKGKSYYLKDLKLCFIIKDSDSQRCGFSISKKVSKKAVERNKLKRRLSHIFKIESENIIKNVDCVFVARIGLLELSFSELKNIVQQILAKSDLYIK